MKFIQICFFLFAFIPGIFAQTSYTYRKEVTQKSVPKLVLETFTEQYDKPLVHNWYVTHITYWYNDVSSGWYSSWYSAPPSVIYIYEKPNFYEVEFTLDPGEQSRAVYNRYGYWYETRTKMKGFPAAIKKALDDSKYSGWKVDSFIERIETNGWPDSVYRFKVKKGLRAEIIRMNAQGEIVQKKEVE